MKKIFLLNLTSFLSAFLLFQIELIIAKLLLPNYGGSYAVWGSCIVFFQAVLLAGYYFSHLLTKKLGMSRYRMLHLGFLLVPLLFFPGKTLMIGNVNNDMLLAMDVFRLLCITIGPVFLVLSTMSIVTQVWLADSRLHERNNPYPLYAWSNLGSFIALLTYPFVFELFLDLSTQVAIWRSAYLLLILLNAIAVLSIPLVPPQIQQNEKSPAVFKSGLIFLLSAGGVMLFLAITNVMTMEIAPVPVLWIIPLGIYLITFILNFKKDPWCPKGITPNISWILGCSLFFYFLLQANMIPFVVEMVILLFFLFVLLMYVNRQLFVMKPQNNKELTRFYLMISLGGFVGGFMTTWVIPLISTSLSEFMLAIILIAISVPVANNPTISRWEAGRYIIYYVVLLFAWPLKFVAYNVWGVLAMILVLRVIFTRLRSVPYAVIFTFVITMILSPYLDVVWSKKIYSYSKRNYYGVTKIFNEKGTHYLYHSAITHGYQLQHNDVVRKIPTSYYGMNSPIFSLLADPSYNWQRMGAIGLGAGTLAAYGRPGSVIDFFELDPEMVRVATSYFSFTKDSSANIKYILGDARLSLQNAKDVKYDVLVVDAFSGDSVPVHLLTKEMMDIYREHLTSKGILLIHASNRYLNLDSAVFNAANAAQGLICTKSSGKLEVWETPSYWISITWNKKIFDIMVGTLKWDTANLDLDHRVWTDEYSSVIPYLKQDMLLNPFKNFAPFSW